MFCHVVFSIHHYKLIIKVCFCQVLTNPVIDSDYFYIDPVLCSLVGVKKKRLFDSACVHLLRDQPVRYPREI